MRLLLLSSLTLALLGCPSPAPLPDPDVGSTDDGGSTDGGLSDSSALDGGAADAPPPELGYLEDVHPLFEAAGCSTFACHGGTAVGAGLIVYMPSAQIAYDDMVDQPSRLVSGMSIVRPGEPDASRLVLHAEDTHVPMGILTADQAALVRRWVLSGAAYSRTGSTDPGDVDDAPTTSCDLAGARHWPFLPEACLPRCTAATWDAVVACRTEPDVAACQDAALASDPTASTTVTGGTDDVDLGCALCVNWQTRSCLDAACPLELAAVDRCAVGAMGVDCAAANGALAACQSAHPEIVTCQRAHDPLCVAEP